MKNSHMTYNDRLEIENGLKLGATFTDIAMVTDKTIGTIRNEILNHREKKYP